MFYYRELWLVENAIRPRQIVPLATPASGVPGKRLRFRRAFINDERKGEWRSGRVRTRQPLVRDLHASLRGALLLCLCIGLFPVSGLMGMDTRAGLRFSWCSFIVFYSTMSLGGQFFMTAMCTYRITNKGFNLGSFCKFTGANLMFYGSALVSSVLFFRLALGWPRLIRAVTALERSLPVSGRRVTSACNLTALTVLVLAAVEHILSLVFGLHLSMTCSPHAPVLQAYFKYAMPWIFDYFQFSLWKGFLCEVFNLQSTFIWNFIDVFIMVLSLHLTAHFKRLNRTLDHLRDKVDASWGKIRLRYCRLSRIVQIVDASVSGLVLVSFASNLFFICLQLFNSLRKQRPVYSTACNQENQNKILHGWEHSIYFGYSFTFLMLRALLVSLQAASVHTAARAPARALYDVPTSAFRIEAQRFLIQVNFSTVALSGLKFFYVTRSMILTVVGTIVTYELVLLQFITTGGSEGAMVTSDMTNGTQQ